jgi:cell division protein FtsB
MNRRVVVTLVVLLPILAFVTFSNRGIIQRVRLTNEIRELEEKIRQTEIESKRLQAEVKALQTDRRAIEKVAREKYGMVRQGETVYKVVHDK